MIVAVDGPAASGKGTIARALAARFGLPHLDTGLLYRAVGWWAHAHGADLDDEAEAVGVGCGFPPALLDDPALRAEAAGAAASRVSAHPAVREALLARQRGFAEQPGGAVLDGRDIGTVIAPGADAKLFITATPEVRAARRFAELRAAHPELTLAQVLADIQGRDARDSGRSAAPLLRAPDAALLDTSEMGIGDAVRRAIALVEVRTGPASR